MRTMLVGMGILRVIDAAVAPIEGMRAKGRVKLAPEPKGKRFGLFDAEGRAVDIESPIGPGWKGADGVKPIRAVMVGDSLVAGCGVDDQSKGIMPLLASRVAARTGRPVAWRTVGRLGATARRVRYRMIGDIDDKPDVLIVCVGSNDMLAGRSVREWAADIAPVLDAAKARAGKVVLFSSGQPHRSPVLPGALRRDIECRINAQTATSRRLCEARGVSFLDLTHTDQVDPSRFWAVDGFHPGTFGYVVMADAIMRLLFDGARE
ncbi:MAG: SGNH/GDSL hydrolase family protein [Bifidobacterium scardovii]